MNLRSVHFEAHLLQGIDNVRLCGFQITLNRARQQKKARGINQEGIKMCM